MNAIIKEVLAFAPTNASKLNLARWIKSKWRNFSWEEAHYHALQAVLSRLDGRIREMFVSVLDVEPDEEAIRKLFHDSLSEHYDYVCEWVDVPRCRESIEQLIEQNL